MKEYYRDHALDLFKHGYFPIPIQAKSKIPLMSKGESWQCNITEDQVTQWAENGKGGGSIALTGVSGIDFDIKDSDVSNLLLKYVRNNVSEDVLVRIGLAPKFLIPVSSNSDIKKKSKNTWYDKEGIKHEIEMLCFSDQYFLVFGIHPDTGKEYRWVKNKSVLNVHAEDLPIFTEFDIAGIEDEFDRIAESKGWTRDNPCGGDKKNRKKSVKGLDLADVKLGGAMADTAGIAELSAWLKLLPSAWVDDRDNWIIIGAALHHETGGSNEGWMCFDEWSKTSEKYKGRKDTIDRWESFSADKGLKDGSGCSTRGTIIHILKQAGIWSEAKRVGDAARAATITSQTVEECVDSIKDVVEEMNKRHAIIKIGGKIRVMDELWTSDGLDLTFLSVPDFNTMYDNKTAPDPFDPKKRKSISRIWIKDPMRREFKGIVFEPTGTLKSAADLEGYYNIYRGLARKPKKGDWSLFKDHIHEVIASGSDSIRDWLIAWFARMVQKPGGNRPGTCVVMRGGQGTGKGIFVNAMGEIFGPHYMPVSHASQIAGRFNKHLSNTILSFVDEGFWAGDKKAEGVLKSLITEPWVSIEQKGIDTIKVRNNINLIMASNSEWVVPADKAERRFFVLDIADSRQGDKQYFNKIIKQMYKEDGIEAMLFDLLRIDLSKIDLSVYEQTEGLFHQKIHSMTTEMSYWHERLQDGKLLAYMGDESNSSYTVAQDWLEVKSDDQYADYLIYSEKLKERFPKTPTEFGIFLKRICPGITVKQKRSGTDRVNFRQFPGLLSCRNEFSKQLKYPIQWEFDDEDENDGFQF